MLLAPDLLVPLRPPQQATLNQRWLWFVLIFLLSVTLVLRILGLDLGGAMLTVLMLTFAVVMTRDGMKEMERYVTIYTMLCSLNLFFDILPLLTELGGRISRHTEPGTTITGDGIKQTTYTITIKTTPFFDSEQGLIYNIQSAALVLSPICMALGMYLSFCAQREMQQDEDYSYDEELRGGLPAGQLLPGRAANVPESRQQPMVGAGGFQGGMAAGSQGRAGPRGFERFQGTAQKLSS